MLAIVATIVQTVDDDFLLSLVYVSLSKEMHTREYSSMCFSTCVYILVCAMSSEKSPHDVFGIETRLSWETIFCATNFIFAEIYLAQN